MMQIFVKTKGSKTIMSDVAPRETMEEVTGRIRRNEDDVRGQGASRKRRVVGATGAPCT